MPDDAPDQPRPNPALRRLDRLVGEWDMRGRTPGADRDDITGRTRFRWLHGEGDSFFLLQEMRMDYAGQPILSHELIGHDPKTGAFASQVYSNMAAEPWPYAWDVRGDDIVIAISHGPMDATYTGRFAADGNRWSGGWRPNPGADQTINAPYDVVATRRGQAAQATLASAQPTGEHASVPNGGSTMKILLASLAAACLAAAAPSGASVAAQVNPQYRQCVQQNMQGCYPVDGNGNIYKPNPDTPEGEAFAQCSADVRAMCASLYPG